MTTPENETVVFELSEQETPPTIVCQWCWRKIGGVPVLKYLKHPPSKKMVYEWVFCGSNCIEACEESGYVTIEGEELQDYLYARNVRAFFARHFSWPERATYWKAFYSQLRSNQKNW